MHLQKWAIQLQKNPPAYNFLIHELLCFFDSGHFSLFIDRKVNFIWISGSAWIKIPRLLCEFIVLVFHMELGNS